MKMGDNLGSSIYKNLKLKKRKRKERKQAACGRSYLALCGSRGAYGPSVSANCQRPTANKRVRAGRMQGPSVKRSVTDCVDVCKSKDNIIIPLGQTERVLYNLSKKGVRLKLFGEPVFQFLYFRGEF
jgi:hypothetical protein